MKTILYPFLLIFAMCSLQCKKTVDTGANITPQTVPDSVSHPAGTTPYPQTVVADCQFAPDYGDSIFFLQPTGNTDYTISPVNNISVGGHYFAWPAGLTINGSTGTIDITASITGLRYDIGFVKAGTTDTCLSSLILGGVSYADSIYSMAHSDTTSIPYFNGNINGPNICNASGPNKGNKCAFDIYNNAKNQGIVIDKKSGFVNLKKTMQQIDNNYAILFDGETLYSTFYYQIADKSNNAIQQMQIEFIYYSDRSKIPASLIAQVSAKQMNLWNGILIATTASPKPPLIIITRN